MAGIAWSVAYFFGPIVSKFMQSIIIMFLLFFGSNKFIIQNKETKTEEMKFSKVIC
jgi:hypothetical protein